MKLPTRKLCVDTRRKCEPHPKSTHCPLALWLPLSHMGPLCCHRLVRWREYFKTFPLILFFFFFFNDRAVILGVSISEFQRLWLEWKWVAVIWPFKSSYTVSHFCKPCELLSAEGQGLTPSSVRSNSEDPLRPTRQHMCQSPVGESFESVDESVCPNLGPGEGMGGAGVGWTWPS